VPSRFGHRIAGRSLRQYVGDLRGELAAADYLGVGAVGGGHQNAARAALETVEITGDGRLGGNLIVLDRHDLDVEPHFLEEAALRRHQEDAGIAVGLNETVPPRFCRLRRSRSAAKPSAMRRALVFVMR
jgi:hypothetical protein